MQRLIELYTSTFSRTPQTCVPLEGAGSNRKYYRLDGVVGVVGTSREENDAFCYLSDHFTLRHLPVPRVLARSADGLRYLQQDLGTRSLFDALRRGREAGGQYNKEERELLRRVVRLLPRVQVEGAEGLDFSRCYPQSDMDRTSVLFDLNYFKYCFLKPAGTDFHELRLEEDFQRLADDLTSEADPFFLYRDFQARNIMLDADDQPWLIDFQGGRRGALPYDVASFLWQASARYPDELREALIREYIDALGEYTAVDEKAFRRRLRLFVVFRLLQVLGAYGFRGYFERKKHFLDSIPPALDNLRAILPTGALAAYPHLADVLSRLVEEKKEGRGEQPAREGLTVRVVSFSYKKGLPDDPSGNGGGYIFDCRAPHNPGRYEKYKTLTGLDRPVIQFLEDDGEILRFLDSVRRLADFHVERYLERGFTHLMFAFGCTGGQHRSVYSAQHLAEHLHDRYGVRVELLHREQHISQTLPEAGRQAMVFAAGLGTRLRPLTDTMPKALVPVGGRPLLQTVLERLHDEGFTRVVVNVHHFADQIEEWLARHTPQGMNITTSDERAQLLETGGAIKHAAPLLRAAGRFLIHNVDILSNCRLGEFYEAGEGHDATLLVSERKTQRYLLFDATMRLVGWTNIATGEVKSPYPDLDPARCRRLAFAGIHQMSPRLFPRFTRWPDRFSIIDFYLSLCAEESVYGYVQPDLRLLDVGKTESLAEAERFLS